MPKDYTGRELTVGHRVIRVLTHGLHAYLVTEEVTEVGDGWVKLNGRVQKLRRTDMLVIHP